jgi:hypothetical protein
MTSEIVQPMRLEWMQGREEPLESFSRPLEPVTWGEAALDDRAAFDTELRAAGLSERGIEEALAVRDEAAAKLLLAQERLKPFENVMFCNPPPEYCAAHNFYSNTRKTVLENLVDWWRERVTTVEAVDFYTARIPLFVLGTPKDRGCTSKWSRDIISGFSGGGTLHIAGNGLASGSASTYVSYSGFQADSSDIKLIFCDVKLRLVHIEIHEPAKPSVRTWRIDFADSALSAIGLLILAPNMVPPLGEFIRPYPLAGDTSGALATYSETYKQQKNKKANIGFKVQGVDLGLTTSFDCSDSIKIEFLLKGGTDYGLYYAKDCDGVLFGNAQ